MLLLLLFAFIAGLVTILSPCILPVLPIVLSSSIGGVKDKRRPYGVVLGFVASFTFFTLFLASIVNVTGLPADSLRLVSVFVIGSFGLSLLVPAFQVLVEKVFSVIAQFMPQTQGRGGFSGGLIVGFSLGLLWTPCVGPILASVISLAITGEVNAFTFLITLVYAMGTAIPMFLIIKGGQSALQRVPWLVKNTAVIQRGFGVVMILTAIAIYANWDRKIQTLILDTFPSYGSGLTSLEDIRPVREQLEQLLDDGAEVSSSLNKPLFEMTAQGPLAAELIAGGEWFNSPPLQLTDLKGKVVLIDFWTYTCINCQRTFPYLRTWHETYKDQGLVIIGVHTPEFAFEREADNVRQALADFDLNYPVMQDNDFATWRAYNNRYWPAKYLIDANGVIRYRHFGEGKYEETEQEIRDLLAEAGQPPRADMTTLPEYRNYARTPETYLGYERTKGMSSPESIARDKEQSYSLPQKPLQLNRFAYEGEWTVRDEHAALGATGGKLHFKVEAAKVYLVMGAADGVPKKVKVLVDGDLYQEITVNATTLYTLVDLELPKQMIVTLEFVDGGVEAFAFTFG